MANLIFAAPALIFIDRRGRRALLLYTIPVMFIFLLTAGFCSLIPDHSLKFRVVVALLYLFVIAYSPGMGPVPFTYAAEVFPIEIRELGMGWAVAVRKTCSAV
jgi:MFS family permease